MNNIRMLALTRQIGDERHHMILKYLGRMLHVEKIIIDLPCIYKIINLAKTFSFRKELWRERSKKNSYHFKKMSKHISDIIKKKYKDSYDVIFLLEGLYSTGIDDEVCKPYILYEDTTSMVVRKQWPPWVPDTMRTNEYKQLERSCYNNAEIIFTFSNMSRNSFIEDYGVDPARIFTVYIGYNFELSDVSMEKKKSKQLLFVGYDFKLKGGYLLLEAFNRIYKEDTCVKLIIVGSEIKVDNSGVIVYGKISDRKILKTLYDESNIFVLPSYTDALPHAMLEAMGSKNAIIVSDNSGGADLIQNGINGFVVPTGDVDKLYESIKILINNPDNTKSMGQFNYDMIKDRLNWEVIANNIYDRIIRDVIKKI